MVWLGASDTLLSSRSLQHFRARCIITHTCSILPTTFKSIGSENFCVQVAAFGLGQESRTPTTFATCPVYVMRLERIRIHAGDAHHRYSGQRPTIPTYARYNRFRNSFVPWGGEIRPRTQSDEGLAVLSQYTPPQIIRIAPADPIPFLCSDFPPNRQRPIRRPNYLSVGSVGIEPTTNVPPTKLKPFGVRPACGASVNCLQSTSNRGSQVQYQTYTRWFAALPIELTPRSTPPHRLFHSTKALDPVTIPNLRWGILLPLRNVRIVPVRFGRRG